MRGPDPSRSKGACPGAPAPAAWRVWLLDRPASAVTPETPGGNCRAPGDTQRNGKETDREARLEITLDRVPDLESHKAIVTDIVGEWAGAVARGSREQVPIVEWLTAPGLHLPEGMSMEQASAALAEYRREAILHRWPDMPLAAIDGSGPLKSLAIRPSACD